MDTQQLPENGPLVEAYFDKDCRRDEVSEGRGIELGSDDPSPLPARTGDQQARLRYLVENPASRPRLCVKSEA